MLDLSKTIDLMVSEVRSRTRLPDEKVNELIYLIVSTNFPKCLEKYLEGEEWRV